MPFTNYTPQPRGDRQDNPVEIPIMRGTLNPTTPPNDPNNACIYFRTNTGGKWVWNVPAQSWLISPIGAGGGGSNLTMDVWQDFELAALNTTELDAHDHFATTGRWSITNPSALLTTSGTAAFPLVSTVGGVADNPDTLGISYNCNASGVAGFCKFQPPVAQNNISFGFWHKFPGTFNGTFTEHDILTVETTLGVKNIYIKLADGNIAANVQSIHIFNPVDSYSAGIVVSPATWYWVNVSYANNNATGMKLRVYNQTGVQVGVENTRSTAADSGVIDAVIGSLIGGNPFVGNLLFDDFCINWTTFPYPFGP